MTGTNLLKKYKILAFTIIGLLFIFNFFSHIDSNLNYGSADSYTELLRAYNIENEGTSSILDRQFLVPASIIPLKTISNLNFEITQKIIYIFSLFASIVFLFKFFNKEKDYIKILFIIILLFMPYIAFMALEMERAPLLLLFFISALYYYKKYDAQDSYKHLHLSLIFTSFMILVHVTSYIFLGVLFILFLSNKNRIKNIMLLGIYSIGTLSLFYITKKIFNLSAISETSSVAVSGFLINLTNGFSEIGGTFFLQSIIDFISPLIFYLSLLGAIILLINYKKLKVPQKSILIWYLIVTLFFIVQYKSFSHSSRYPYYVIFPAVYIALYAVRKVISSFSNSKKIILITIILISIITLYSEQDLTYYKDRWEPHSQVCDYLIHTQVEEENLSILYLGWPSITSSCMQQIPTKNLYHFGWNRVNLTEIDREFIISNNIKYYIKDHTGSDYYNSSEIVFDNLNEDFDLILIEKFKNEKSQHFYVELYEIK